MIEHTVLNRGGVSPGNGRWRELAELLDPAAFEERLRDARARRAIALATRAATKPTSRATTAPRPGRATPPILPTHPGACDIEAPVFVPPFARVTADGDTPESGAGEDGQAVYGVAGRADDRAAGETGETQAQAIEDEPAWGEPGDRESSRHAPIYQGAGGQEPDSPDTRHHASDPYGASRRDASPRKRGPRIEIAPGPERRWLAGLAALPPFLSRLGARAAALASDVTIPAALTDRITGAVRFGRGNPRMVAAGVVLASLSVVAGAYLLAPNAPETAEPAPAAIAEAPAVAPDAPREIAAEATRPDASVDTAAVEAVPAPPLPQTMPEPTALPASAEDPVAETELTAAQAMPEPDPGLMPSPEPALPEPEVAAAPTPTPAPAPDAAPEPAAAPADALALRPLARPGDVPPITASAPVLTTWERTRVVVNVPGGGTTGDVVATEAAIAAAGFPNVQRARVAVAQERPNVRYFHAGDAEAAQALATATGSVARNFTWHTPVPREGYLELWLPGSAPREASAPAPAENMILGILRDRAAQN